MSLLTYEVAFERQWYLPVKYPPVLSFPSCPNLTCELLQDKSDYINWFSCKRPFLTSQKIQSATIGGLPDLTEFDLFAGWKQSLQLVEPIYALFSNPLFYQCISASYNNFLISVYCNNSILSDLTFSIVSSQSTQSNLFKYFSTIQYYSYF